MWALLVALSLAQARLGQSGQLLGSLFLLGHSEKTNNALLRAVIEARDLSKGLKGGGRLHKQYQELIKGFLGRLPCGVEGSRVRAF